MEAIEVGNLTKRYDSFTAVDSISFKVEEGEIFGFLGPNGSGKSITIRMLTGIIKPDEGTAVIMGHDIKNDAIRAKQAMDIVPEMSNAYVCIRRSKFDPLRRSDFDPLFIVSNATFLR